MTSITIEQAKNGWIVAPSIFEENPFRGVCGSDSPTRSFMVFRTIEELAKELPNILTETKVTEPA